MHPHGAKGLKYGTNVDTMEKINAPRAIEPERGKLLSPLGFGETPLISCDEVSDVMTKW
jgi:hypothetical protein